MMVNGHRKNMKLTCIKEHMLPLSMYGIEELEKKPKGTIEGTLTTWQSGEIVSKVQASKHIHPLMVHLQKVSHLCEFFH